MARSPTRHFDLGCGPVPRNPYRRVELCGVDISPRQQPGCTVLGGNLSIEPIPFPTDHFDSVSAFDFLEHVPRALPTADGLGTRLPFIELMSAPRPAAAGRPPRGSRKVAKPHFLESEISRVLRPGGMLYAVTPCYPSREAFQVPTHVNIITDRTHLYFSGNEPLGRMYGFTGYFTARRVEWRVLRDSVEAVASLSLRQRFRRFSYQRKGQLSHLLWEFECNKPV